MKKDVRVILLVFPLLLLGADRHAGAVEVSANATDVKVPIADSDADRTNNRIVNDGEGNMGGDLDKGSKEKTENYNEEESFSETLDKKSLEEPKPKDSGGNHNLSYVANSTTVAMEDSHVEGCDPSNSCVDEKHKFIACLRVPGQDSLDLSLLIHNKGTTVLHVEIVAPDFVHPEKTSVLLKPKKNKEVRVVVKDEASDSTITLQAKDSNCSLNLRNTIPTSIRNETSKTTRFLDLTTHITVSVLLFAAVSAGGAWLCVRFWRRRASRYQKVDVVLPVSGGGSKETDEADGWDDGWGDDWDEEAPKTPSKPVSTLSFKGLASRRMNKDGWKD